MHVQTTCSLGYIAIAQLVDTLDMFPTDAIRAHGVFGWGRKVSPSRQKGVGDVGGICRFAQVIGGADLDRRDSGCNRTVPGQHDNAAIRTLAAQNLDNIQSVAILKPHTA